MPHGVKRAYVNIGRGSKGRFQPSIRGNPVKVFQKGRDFASMLRGIRHVLSDVVAAIEVGKQGVALEHHRRSALGGRGVAHRARHPDPRRHRVRVL